MIGGQRPLHVRGQLSLELVAAVLEPDFHLGLRELQGAREARSLRAAQIALHVKSRLELKYLSLGEDGARFLLYHGFGVHSLLLLLLVVVLLLRLLSAALILRTGSSGERRCVSPALNSGLHCERSDKMCFGAAVKANVKTPANKLSNIPVKQTQTGVL